MLHVLIGENSYGLEKRLRELTASAGEQLEAFDGASLTREQLLSSTMAQSLFAQQRTIVLKRASENSELWNELPIWLDKIADHIHLIVVEPKPDKRTSTYKWLQKHTDVEVFEAWSVRNHGEAVAWLSAHAKQQQVELDNKLTQQLLQRVGYDQWQLHHAVEKLALRGKDSTLSIDDIIESSVQDTVFELLQAALDGEGSRILEIAHRLKQTEDPYAVFGLLASQITQLAVLSTTDIPTTEIAKDTGLHPFSLQKLKPHARRLGREAVRDITQRLAKADRQIKSSDIDVWTVLEQQLLHIANK